MIEFILVGVLALLAFNVALFKHFGYCRKASMDSLDKCLDVEESCKKAMRVARESAEDCRGITRNYQDTLYKEWLGMAEKLKRYEGTIDFLEKEKIKINSLIQDLESLKKQINAIPNIVRFLKDE